MASPKQSNTKKKNAKNNSKVMKGQRRFSVWLDDLRSRRPHRSLHLTRRRDYKRNLDINGYWAFTGEVWRTLWANKKLFMLIVVCYVVLGIFLGTMSSQDTYNAMNGTVHAASDGLASGSVGAIIQAGAISTTSFLSGNRLSDIQKVYLGIVFILTWLTTVWLLREIKSGRRPKLRDGIYNAGAPIVSTLLVMVWFLVQLLPLVVLSIIYGSLAQTGLLASAAGTFIFVIALVLTVSLVLYWTTATFFAAIIVTLPGMYPLQALRAAGDIVIGRRLRVLYRIIWLLAADVIAWFAVMIPIVLLDTWLAGHFDWVAALPWVPLVALILTAAVVVWSASYIYLFYRKVVEDDSKPA